ncbi:MAG: hypothetical protein RL757_377 [Bacteroidota bacterium]|jgi:hypothetical protein
MKFNHRYVLLLGVIVLTVLARVMPHVFNFTPVAAVALFGTAYLSNRLLAFLLPLVSLFVSDLWLNNTVYRAFYPETEGIVWFSNVGGYVGFALIALLGLRFLRHSEFRVQSVLGCSLAASALFFLVSNGSVWLESNFYPKTFSGLMTCYAAGLPFLNATVLGDLFYASIFFGAFEWAKQHWVVLRKV